MLGPMAPVVSIAMVSNVYVSQMSWYWFHLLSSASAAAAPVQVAVFDRAVE